MLAFILACVGPNSTYIRWSLIHNCFQEPFSSIGIENITWETMSLSDILAVFQLKHIILVFVVRYEKCHKCMQPVNHRGRAAKSKPSGPMRTTAVFLLPLIPGHHHPDVPKRESPPMGNDQLGWSPLASCAPALPPVECSGKRPEGRGRTPS